jgi:hypothetical protein
VRNSQPAGNLTAAQNFAGRRALVLISRVAAIDQNVSVDEHSHAEAPYRRRIIPRASSRDSRGLGASPTLGLLWLLGLDLTRPPCVGIEPRQTLLGGQLLSGLRLSPDQLHSNAVAGGNPFQFVAGADAILVGNLRRNRQLKFGCHLGIMLTSSRIESLLKLRALRGRSHRTPR